MPSKYPEKKAYKGPNKGKLSGNPLGKNPDDVWNIPNVKSNHIEKTIHPCQFPIALVERLILALTNKQDVVFDPYMGVASSGVAAFIHNRKFIGIEKNKDYFDYSSDTKKYHFNLPNFSLNLLKDEGISSIEWTGHCTYSDPENFFSYRRSYHKNEPDYGRMISAIML